MGGKKQGGGKKKTAAHLFPENGTQIIVLGHYDPLAPWQTLASKEQPGHLTLGRKNASVHKGLVPFFRSRGVGAGMYDPWGKGHEDPPKKKREVYLGGHVHLTQGGITSTYNRSQSWNHKLACDSWKKKWWFISPTQKKEANAAVEKQWKGTGYLRQGMEKKGGEQGVTNVRKTTGVVEGQPFLARWEGFCQTNSMYWGQSERGGSAAMKKNGRVFYQGGHGVVQSCCVQVAKGGGGKDSGGGGRNNKFSPKSLKEKQRGIFKEEGRREGDAQVFGQPPASFYPPQEPLKQY